MKHSETIKIVIGIISFAVCQGAWADNQKSSLELLWEKSDSLVNTGKYREAAKVASKVADEAKKIHDDEMLMNAYSALMLSYQFLGDFDKSAKYGTICLDYDRASGDSANISSSLNNMAVLYYNMKQPEQALTCAMEAMNIEKALDPDGPKLARRYGRLSEISHALGKYEEGLQYAKMALAIDEKLGDSLRIAYRKCQMADNLRELDNMDKARELYEECLPVFIKQDVSHSLAVTYYDLGLIYGQMGEEEISKDYLQKAFKVVQQTGDNMIVQRVYEELVKRVQIKDERMRFYHNWLITLLFGFAALSIGAVIIVLLRHRLKKKTETLNKIYKTMPKTVEGVNITPREMDVIRLSGEGLQYKEIADRLGVSYKTVDTIKSRLFKKLGINNTTELVLYALKNDLISK